MKFEWSKCDLCDLKGDGYAMPRIKRGKGKKIMVVGEAPGREEAKRHIAFIGKAGKELDKWIEYMHIDNYYITNVVKHRPVKDNRDIPPTASEVATCFPYLKQEILAEIPDLILTLGNPASYALGSNMPISKSIIHYFYLSRARRNKINSNKGETEENNEVQ